MPPVAIAGCPWPHDMQIMNPFCAGPSLMAVMRPCRLKLASSTPLPTLICSGMGCPSA